MKGYGDGKFLPDKETTREEVCAVLYAWMKGAEKKDSNFLKIGDNAVIMMGAIVNIIFSVSSAESLSTD